MSRSFLSSHLPTLQKLLTRRELQKRLAEIRTQLGYTPYNLSLLEEQAEISEQLRDPGEVGESFRELGQAYVRRGLYARAIATYNRLLELNPETTGVHQELAVLIAKERAERKRRAPLEKTDPNFVPRDAGSVPLPSDGGSESLSSPGPRPAPASPRPAPPVAAGPEPAARPVSPSPEAARSARVPPTTAVEPAAPVSNPPSSGRATQPVPTAPVVPRSSGSQRPGEGTDPGAAVPVRDVSAIWVDAEPLLPSSEVLEEEKDLPEEEKKARSNERATSVLFELFQPEALEEVLASTCIRNWGDQEIIFREGDPGSSMFLLVDGRVQVVGVDRHGREVQIDELGTGEIFGGVSVVNDRPRAATVRALHWVTAIEIGKSRIEAISQEHPHVMEVLRGFVEERAQRTIDILVHGQDPAVR